MNIEKYFNITINYTYFMDNGMNTAKVITKEFNNKKKAYNWTNQKVNQIESEGDYISEVTITSEIIIKNN